jgi:hypothetical protein
MIKHNRILFTAIVLPFLLAPAALATEMNEPERPVVDQAFDAEKEARTQAVANLHLEEAFATLKAAEFLTNEPLLHKTIFTAFDHRKADAIALSIQTIRQPIFKVTDGTTVSRADDFYVAKNVLHVFPNEAFSSLRELYGKTDPVTKGNIVRVFGQMAGGEKIRNLLIDALDDKMFCEEEHPETSGEPLRICDVAYNQLVLRYRIENVARTIGSAHELEIRNYHIDVLKEMLSTF